MVALSPKKNRCILFPENVSDGSVKDVQGLKEHDAYSSSKQNR